MNQPEEKIYLKHPQSKKYYFDKKNLEDIDDKKDEPGLNILAQNNQEVESKQIEGGVSNKEKERAVMTVDLLMENYVDKKNNLRKFKQLYKASDVDSEGLESLILNDNMEKIWEETTKKGWLIDFASITQVLDIPGVEEELLRRFFDETLDIKDKIIIAQIISDITYYSIDDVDVVSPSYLEELEHQAMKSENPLYYRFFLSILAERCEACRKHNYDWLYSDDELEKEYKFFYYEYHNNKFDNFKLKLSPFMKQAINEGSGDGNYFGELYPIQKIVVPDLDYNGEEDTFYAGDYLISELSPERYGVYSKEGTWVGYLRNIPEKTEEIGAWNPSKEVIRETLCSFSASLESNDFIKRHPKFQKEGWVYVKTVKDLLKSEKLQEFEKKNTVRVIFKVILQKRKDQSLSHVQVSVAGTFDRNIKGDNEAIMSELSRIINSEISFIPFENISDKERERLSNELQFESIDNNRYISQDFKRIVDENRPAIEVGDPNDLLNGIHFSNPDEDMFLFKLMVSLPFREKIKESTGVDIASLDLKNQYYFLQYIGKKTEGEFGRVVKFIKESSTESASNNRVKAFLSLENNEKMGEVILEIGEKLKDQPEIADLLFAEYAKMVESAEMAVEGIARYYEEMFFEKKVNKNELVKTILRRANKLFVDASNKLQRKEVKDKSDIITELIDDLTRENNNLYKILKELKQISMNLNRMSEEARLMARKVEIELDKLKSSKRLTEKGWSEDDIEDYKDYVQMSHDIYDDPDTWRAISEAYESEEVEDAIERHQRYDSNRIIKLINHYELLYENKGEELISNINDSKKENLSENEAEELTLREKEELGERLHVLVKKFKNLLGYQQRFEQKLEQLVYGHESADLPNNYQQVISSEIEHYQLELNQNGEYYFPAGISMEPAKKGEAHKKPIDALLLMFWLQNQEKNSQLIVADTVQRHNYGVLPSDQRPADPEKAAIVNGTRDRKWYQAVKKVFNLGNIEMSENLEQSEYQKIVESSKFKEQMAQVKELEKESPIIGAAIEKIAEGIKRRALSSRDVSEEERQKITESIDSYGREEIAFILAMGENKIGHQREVRYDMIAKIIPIYRVLRAHSFEIEEILSLPSEQKDQALVELSLYLGFFQKFPAEYFKIIDLFSIEQRLKSLEQNKIQLPKQQRASALKDLKEKASNLKGMVKQIQDTIKSYEEIELIEKTIKELGVAKTPKEIPSRWREVGDKLTESRWFKELELPEFYYPKGIDSLTATFTEKGESVIFKEQYSTYKAEQEQEVYLQPETAQVIASTDLLAAAKLLVLSSDSQKKYFNRVLKPLIINYYMATSKSKEEAVEKFRNEFENISTIAEVVEFIQRKIVWPVEMELEASKREN